MSAHPERYIKVFIGRFQPFHNGHLKALRAAIDTSDLVVVVIGSADAISTPKNPWSLDERMSMILGALNPAERLKVSIASAVDMPGMDGEWVKQVKTVVQWHARRRFAKGKLNYTLIGCHKGADTYYLALYRGWGRDLMPQSEALNATDIREAYFSRVLNGDCYYLPRWSEIVPGSTYAFMMLWRVAYMPLYNALVRVQERRNETRNG